MASVSVFGLGKIGHTLAACLAAAGNRVIGYDILPQAIEAVNTGRYQTTEPEVDDRVASAKPGFLTATSDPAEAIVRTDVTMVVVPTPSNTLGGYSLRFVLSACRVIGDAMRKKGGPHTVALVSTVLPGASDAHIIPALEAASGRKVGSGLSYCYNPSFIALGEVVKGFEQPDYVLIGEADKAAGDALATVHRSIIKTDVPIERMSPIEAEIAKIACNTHETMRVAFANMLFAVCSEVPDANVDRITGALSYRMGQRFFKGAVPYGGPCWPRDNRALAVFMDAIGVPSIVPRTIDLSNAEHGMYVLRKVLEQARRDDTVGLLGLAYKPGTAVIEAAFGMDLAGWLMRDGRRVVAWDPLALHEAREALGDRITYASSAEDCLRKARVVVIINPMREFTSVDWKAAQEATVMDPWRCLTDEAIRSVGNYVAMGHGDSSVREQWPRDELRSKLHALNE
ncbi:MAG: nucleotide sugar dehydrogenase [Vulcanimicrobiaceae bacterium]